MVRCAHAAPTSGTRLSGARDVGLTMAKYGVPMLEKLVLRYCPKSGSSTGMREFVDNTLPSFKLQNPSLTVQLVQALRRHPKAIGLYRNGQAKPVDVKNLGAREIMDRVGWMRTSHGRSQDYQVTSGRHLSRNPSIQGIWTVDTFAAQLQRRNDRWQAKQQQQPH